MDLEVVLAFAVVIVGLISTNGTHGAVNNSKPVVNDDEIIILGLFSLHCERSRNKSIACGDFRLDGYEEMNAMLFAVREINNDPTILPGITVRVKIEDTCSSVKLAMKTCLNYTITKYRYKYACTTSQSVEDPPIHAIVGERDSDISRTVTNLVSLFHIPVISYGSTSPSLSGVKYFVRTIPPDTFIAQAMVDLLKKFHWNYIILLYSDSEYGRFAADAFRKRLREETENICVAVDEAINAGSLDSNSRLLAEQGIWKKMEEEHQKTKVVVIFTNHPDFSSFLQIGKQSRHDIKKYIWLSDAIWKGQASNVTSELKYAISIIPHQKFIPEFADFFDMNDTYKLAILESFASVKKEWFEELQSLPSNMYSARNSSNDIDANLVRMALSPLPFVDTCLEWRSAMVSFVIDAVYAVAWALHDIHCNTTNASCGAGRKSHITSSDLLSAIKKVNMKNPWSKNQVSFTEKGDPRSVAYAVVLLQTKYNNCFRQIGRWRCLVNENKTCEGNLTLERKILKTSNVTMSKFLGVCGKLCRPGQYKVVDKHFASCCWKCNNCTGNKYSDKTGAASCTVCHHDQWPNSNHTACVRLEPKTLTISHPASVIFLCINALGLLLVLVLTVLIFTFSHSKMKIFSERILCYLLLWGIFASYISSIIVLTDKNKEHCLLLIFLSKIGRTCTTATLLIKTNSVYRTYKKKILKEDPRFFSQGTKVFVVVSLVIIEAILTWLSISFGGENKKTSTITYIHTENENTAYLQCGYHVKLFSKNVFTVLEFSFYWGLLLICAHQAYLTRKITDDAHGLRYVFFCLLAVLVNSILTFLAYSLTDSEVNIKELVLSVHHTFFATVTFACIFIPKVDILVFHPEKDTLHDALSKSIATNLDSVFPSQIAPIQDEPACSSTAPQT